jgi:hypothetical protein
MEKYLNRGYEPDQIEAIKRFLNGEKLSYTTFIDEITITCGYGKLSDIGCFQYELPMSFRKEHNILEGCKTWKELDQILRIKKLRIKKLQRIYETKF